MFYWNKWSLPNVKKAISFYEKAIEMEPEFALPYTGLSACHVFLGAVGVSPPRIAYPKAKEYALKALELDDTIPEAHISLAMVKVFNDWDWEGSEKCFLKALELNPNSAMAHQFYAFLLSNLGYSKKALKEVELAQQLDPLNAPISAMLAYNYFNANMLEESLEQYKKTAELDPEFQEAWSGKGWLYYKMGDMKKAIETFEKVVKFPGFLAPEIKLLQRHFGLVEIDEGAAQKMATKSNPKSHGTLASVLDHWLGNLLRVLPVSSHQTGECRP